MDFTQVQINNAFILFTLYALPIILLFWLLYEVSRFRQSFGNGRPVALAIVSALIVSYIFARMSNFHGGEYSVADGVLVIIILGAGLLERARRKIPFGPNSLAISVIVSILVLYAWGLFTSNMRVEPAPTGAYILVIICLALGLYGRRMANRAQNTTLPKASKTKK